MRTITIYKFEELSDSAKERVIEEMKEHLMETEDQDAIYWAKDDCALLEPEHEEMVKLFGEKYTDKLGGGFMIKNYRRGIIWDGEVGDDEGEVKLAKSSFTIEDHKMFMMWLGIPERFVDRYACEFYSNYIIVEYIGEGLDNPAEGAFHDIANKCNLKWNEHLDLIGRRIAAGVNEYFSDENVITKIEERGLEFLENGKLYKD